MMEIELKLQVPPGSLKAVERAFAAAPTQTTRLQALYFDTADRRLAAAGIALRLRKEGRRWVQTLKSGSAHGLARGESNVVLTGPVGLSPALDAARHDGTLPGQALARVLGAEGGPPPRLLMLYRTDVRRRHRALRTRGGTVELALDRGEIRALGPDGVERCWPVCELEIELRSGAPHAVTGVARRWAVQHGLWLDMRSKAERGDRLARGLASDAPVPAVKAVSLHLDKSMSPAAAWAAVLDNTLAQALPNWSEVAGDSPAADAVHQLRVALRRLRSAERFFQGWPGVPALGCSEAVAGLFRALGATRDRDVLAGGLQREVDAVLATIGEKPITSGAHDDAQADDAGARVAHGLVFIELLAERLALDDGTPQRRSAGRAARAASVASAASAASAEDAVPGSAVEAPSPHAAPDSQPAADLRTLAAARLERWHSQIRRDAKRFDRIDDEARHRLRKRLKRLRYAIEFSAGLFRERAVARYLDKLREAQERLGEYNDVTVAEAAYRPLTDDDPRAWFALGWLAQRRASALSICFGELQRLRKAKPFWR